MTVRPTVQERAYQLALTLPSTAAIRQQLVREGYENVDAHLGSPSLRLALKRVRRQVAGSRLEQASSNDPSGEAGF